MTLDRANAVLSILLLTAMALFFGLVVRGLPEDVRHLRDTVLRIDEPVVGGLPPFQWMPDRYYERVQTDVGGSRLYCWDPFGRPQVRRAWPSTARPGYWESFPFPDELWVGFGEASSEAEEGHGQPTLDVVRRYRELVGGSGRKALYIRAREPWQDVSVEDGPEIRLHGRRPEGRRFVWIETEGGWCAFPMEPLRGDDGFWIDEEFAELDEEGEFVEVEEPLRHRGYNPFKSVCFIEAANRTWPEVEYVVRSAAKGRRSVILRIDEAEGAAVRWGYIVAVLDILMAEGVEVVRFEPGGHTLRFDVPDEPDPLLQWTPPPTPSVTLDLLAGSAGVAFALLVIGFATRRRSDPSRPS